MIKIFTPKAITMVAFISMFISSCHSKVTPEEVNSNPVIQDTGIIRELRDVYTLFRLNDRIDQYKDDFGLTYNNDSVAAIKELKNWNIRCDSLKSMHFYNDTLKKYADEHVQSFIDINNVIADKGYYSKDFEKSFNDYKEHQEKYNAYLFSRYSTSHFIKMSEDEYWKRIDKKQFIKSPVYPKYESIVKKDLGKGLSILKNIIEGTKNFQEKTIYQLELANQMITHFDKLDSSASEEALKIYEDILNSKEYSLYKFEIWRRWRAAIQEMHYGSSKTSEIPNDLYNKKRAECANSILLYYAQHPTDEMAMNQYLDFATHGIVYRFGEYPYGNQNAIEYFELFPMENNNK